VWWWRCERVPKQEIKLAEIFRAGLICAHMSVFLSGGKARGPALALTVRKIITDMVIFDSTRLK